MQRHIYMYISQAHLCSGARTQPADTYCLVVVGKMEALGEEVPITSQLHLRAYTELLKYVNKTKTLG